MHQIGTSIFFCGTMALVDLPNFDRRAFRFSSPTQ